MNIEKNKGRENSIINLLKEVFSMKIFKNTKSKVGFSILIAYILLALIGPLFEPYNPSNSSFVINLAPSINHIFGTNAYGEDLFSRFLAGAAPTIGIGLTVGLISTLISILVGLSAGLIGGKVDKILDGLSYVFIIIPGIMIIIIIGSLFIGIGITFSYAGIFIALALTGWAWGARVLRSQTKSLATRNFIKSSRLVGESSLSIVFRQVIRNLFPLIVSNFFFASMYGVLGLTWIEFFGLGNVDSINWGTMLYWAISNEAYLSGEWWWYVPVSLAIGGLALSFSLLNSGFDEVANPSLKSFSPKKIKKILDNSGKDNQGENN